MAPNQTMTDEFLRAVADSYRAHLDSRKPSVFIAQEHAASVRTAQRWVCMARRRGFLAATEPGLMSGRERSPEQWTRRSTVLRQVDAKLRGMGFYEAADALQNGSI